MEELLPGINVAVAAAVQAAHSIPVGSRLALCAVGVGGMALLWVFDRRDTDDGGPARS